TSTLFGAKDTFFPNHKISETLELPALFGLHPFHLGPFGAFMTPCQELTHIRRGSFCFNINGSVRFISHKSGNSQLIGNRFGTVPEPHALDFAADPYFKM